MSWHVHSDKWPNLRDIEYLPGQLALEAFNPIAAHTSSDRAKAVIAITQEMEKKPTGYLAGETLHASSLIFISEALKPENQDVPISQMIAKAFDCTSGSQIAFYADLKRTILNCAFNTAREEEALRNNAVNIFDKLGKSAPDIAKAIIEDHLPIDQTWEEGTSLALVIGNI